MSNRVLEVLVLSFKLLAFGIIPIPLILILMNISEILADYQASFFLGVLSMAAAFIFIWFWGEKIYLTWMKKPEIKNGKRKSK